MLSDLYPSARVISTRRLRGGLSAQVHAVRVELADGSQKTLVVRRKANGHYRIPRHFRTLEVLAETPVPAPKPLYLDMTGQCFDVPTMIIEHAGHPLLTPRNQADWLGQLASAIYEAHQVTPDNADLRHLASPLPTGPDDDEVDGPDDLTTRMAAALAGAAGRIRPLPPSLIHDDYWPGNTVWKGQQLTAVIDWDGATIGDRRTDVAQCRVDLAFICGAAAADAFLHAYEIRHGEPLQDMWYFDLECANRNRQWFEKWHAGYLDIGIDWVTQESMRRDFCAFAERAMASQP